MNNFDLVNLDERYFDRVHIIIISDGIENLEEDYLVNLEAVGIHRSADMKQFKEVDIMDGNEDVEIKYKKLSFINHENMNDKVRLYGTYNIGHCFSKYMNFGDWLLGLSEEHQRNMKINEYDIHDFLIGNWETGKVKHPVFKHLKMPIHFVMKHRNQGKIESHKWFFKGFCEYMNPEFTQIIDCGSIPLWNSISYIIMHMESFPDVGGAWGEIEWLIPEKKEDGTPVSFIEGSIVRGQYVEYKMSHYLDKATESLFGFVSVLPGAFSTFRWHCVRGTPLNTFLKGAKDEFTKTTSIAHCAIANKYLAEDRIMWLEIIAKKNEHYIIHYIPGAKCLTDPPMTLTNLIRQRRRWFNGSMFATFHVLGSMCRVWKRRNSGCRNVFFMVLYFYMVIQTMLSFILVGLFFSSFSIFIRAVLPSSDWISEIAPADVIEYLYICFNVAVLMLSTTVDVKWAESGFRAWSFCMGLFTILMIICTIYFAAQASIGSYAVMFLLVLFFSYLLPLLLNVAKLKFCDFVKGIWYSVFLSPTYVNVFTIFAISNIHDVSWGSRPSGQDSQMKAAEAKKEDNYKNFRSNFLCFWIVWNLFTGFTISQLAKSGESTIIFYIGLCLAIVLGTKIILSLMHVIATIYHSRLTAMYILTKKSSVFDDVKEYAIPENSKSLNLLC